MPRDKIKVVHLTSVHSPFDSRIFQKECQSLASAGFDVALVVPHGKREVVEGIKIIPVEPASGRFHRMTTTARRVVRLAARQRAGIYHLHDPELLPWCGALKRQGAIVVFDMHEDLPHQIINKVWLPRAFRPVVSRLVKMYERILLENVPTVFAEKSYTVSRRWIKESVDILNFPKTDLIDQMSNESGTPAGFKVGYLGTVTPERGSFRILEALSKVQGGGREIEFDCIGTIPPGHLRELNDRADELGVRGVDYVGYLAPTDGWARMAQSDVGLAVLEPIPNYLESYPTKIFEYMSMGIPSIVSDFPLYREIIEKFQCGILVDPLDAGSIAEAIIRLMDNPDEAAEMGARGKEAARSHFSWESEQEKLIEFYSRLLSSKGNSRD